MIFTCFMPCWYLLKFRWVILCFASCLIVCYLIITRYVTVSDRWQGLITYFAIIYNSTICLNLPSFKNQIQIETTLSLLGKHKNVLYFVIAIHSTMIAIFSFSNCVYQIMLNSLNWNVKVGTLWHRHTLICPWKGLSLKEYLRNENDIQKMGID